MDSTVSAIALTWPRAPAEVPLAQHDLHVWAIPLNRSPGDLANFSATLSMMEQQRAARFRFARHRDRFIAGRGSLRAILARYLQTAPATIDFTYSPKDKPALDRAFAGAGIHFNLAHSEDLALCAVTRMAPIGVDVERIRPLKDADALVARLFSARENALFQSLPDELKPGAFFNLWTRKEALLKATGEGITGGLNRAEVTFLSDEPARLLAIDGDAHAAARWNVQALAPAEGFVGAAAIETQEVRLRCYAFGPAS